MFIDLASAFYRIVKELVLPMKTSQEDLDEMIDRLEIPLLLEGPLRELLSQPTITQKFISDQHLLSLVVEAHTNN